MPYPYVLSEQKNTEVINMLSAGLVDIRNVEIDTSLSTEQRIKSLIKQIKNPYKFKHNDVIINLNFVGDMTLGEKVVDIIENK